MTNSLKLLLKILNYIKKKYVVVVTSVCCKIIQLQFAISVRGGAKAVKLYFHSHGIKEHFVCIFIEMDSYYGYLALAPKYTSSTLALLMSQWSKFDFNSIKELTSTYWL